MSGHQQERMIPRHARNVVAMLLGLTFLTGVLSATEGSQSETLPILETALLQNAPEIIKEMGKQKVKNVGVVSFQVKWDKGQASGNVGPLNRRMANRLETALVLRMSKEDNLRLIRGAGDTVAATGLSHLKAKDRPEFFKLDYEPAWGKGTVKADCLLSGMVSFEPKSNRCKVSIEGFDVSGKIKPLSSFYVQADPRLYSEAGVSFVAARREEDKTKLRRPSARPRATTDALDASPVDVQVYFGDELAPVTRVKDSLEYPEGLSIPEPPAGKKLTVRLIHRNKDKLNYAVVMRVNGQNIVYPELLQPDDLTAKKVLLKPKANLPIRGFIHSTGRGSLFKIDPAPMDPKAPGYGSHTGTISFVVYREMQPGEDVPKPKKPNPAEDPSIPITRGKDLAEVQKLVRERTVDVAGKRVKITGGEEFDPKGTIVDFKPYPGEVVAFTIRYSARTK